LLAIAIWAGVADSIQDLPAPSSACKKASQAVKVALEASKTAFPDEIRREIVATISPVAIQESLLGLSGLMKDQGQEGQAVLELISPQVRVSVEKYLGQWIA
jgi:hypothetical protein